jgi:RsiW-degrading membrane proteinase PrsW (M82 family)
MSDQSPDPYFVTVPPPQPMAGIPSQPQAYQPQAYPQQAYPPPQAYDQQAYPPPQSYQGQSYQPQAYQPQSYPPPAYPPPPPGYVQAAPGWYPPPTTPPVTPPVAGLYTCLTCGYPAGDQAFCPQCARPTPFAPPGAISPHAYPVAAQSRHYVDLRWRDLLPLGDWMRSGVFFKGRIALFLACALTPFLLLQATANDTDARYAAWGFTIYFAVIWLIAIRAMIKPERVSVPRLLQIVAITAVIGVTVAVILEHHFNADASTLTHSIFTIAIPEELAKALPLLLVLVVMKNGIGPRTYLYLGAVSGLTFGAVESMAYSALYNTNLERTGDTRYVTGIIWRLLTDSLFHAALAGIVGVFIGFAAVARRDRVYFVLTGLGLAAVLHGAYDRTAGHWPSVFIAALVMLLFAGYTKTTDDIGGLIDGPG